MEDSSERIVILLSLYAEDLINRKELDELMAYIADSRHDATLHAFMLSEWENLDTSKPFPEPDWPAMLHQIMHSPKIRIPVYKTLWPRIAAAASILLFLSIGYFLLHKKQPAQQIAQNQIHDIAPGRNQATLTLGNGKKIILTKSLNGKLAQQGNTLVQVNNANAIAYTSSGTETNGTVQYNTMSTGRGEQSPYPLILVDGTKVWLNAASSITFPTAFAGSSREVNITGEALFEVAHNSKQPFRVRVKGQTIEDIGTEFNVNAYNDEPVIKTTLLEGSISLTKGKHKSILKPGQQAITQQNNDGINVHDVDTEEATAWKNGYFLFNDEDLQSVMRKVSRWYNVDIVYPDYKLTEIYGGSITRYGNVSKVLDFLEKTGHVRYKIEGKKIIVQKK
jgi:transmembrane sensor